MLHATRRPGTTTTEHPLFGKLEVRISEDGATTVIPLDGKGPHQENVYTEKHWKGELKFKPALDAQTLDAVDVAYYRDYTGPEWWTKQNRGKFQEGDVFFGGGALKQAMRQLQPGATEVTFVDEKPTGLQPYACNDVMRLIDILKPLGVTVDGNVEPEGDVEHESFAHDGCLYIIEDSHIYCSDEWWWYQFNSNHRGVQVFEHPIVVELAVAEAIARESAGDQAQHVVDAWRKQRSDDCPIGWYPPPPPMLVAELRKMLRECNE